MTHTHEDTMPTEPTINLDILAEFMGEGETKAKPEPAAAARRTWADVHAESLKAGRWYTIPGQEQPWRLLEKAQVVGAGKYATVNAEFERPVPDGQPERLGAVATPEAPFAEAPSPVTKSGREKKSEQREKDCVINLRVTAQEKADVKSRADAAGTSISGLLRSLLGLAEVVE